MSTKKVPSVAKKAKKTATPKKVAPKNTPTGKQSTTPTATPKKSAGTPKPVGLPKGPAGGTKISSALTPEVATSKKSGRTPKLPTGTKKATATADQIFAKLKDKDWREDQLTQLKGALASLAEVGSFAKLVPLRAALATDLAEKASDWSKRIARGGRLIAKLDAKTYPVDSAVKAAYAGVHAATAKLQEAIADKHAADFALALVADHPLTAGSLPELVMRLRKDLTERDIAILAVTFPWTERSAPQDGELFEDVVDRVAANVKALAADWRRKHRDRTG